MPKEKSITALKEIFAKAKVLREKGESTWDSDFGNEQWRAVAEVGRKKIYELKDEIYPYLEDDADSFFKDQAILTLGSTSRLHLPEFRDKAYEIWINDCEEIRYFAFGVWADYYLNCQDKVLLQKVLPIFYKVMRSDDYTITTRVTALGAIIQSGDFVDEREGYQIFFKLAELTSHQQLEREIDWLRVDKIMNKYAPEALEVDINKKFKYLQARWLKPLNAEKKRIKALKYFFEKEKTNPSLRTPSEYFELDDDRIKYAIIDVGRKEFLELKDEIYPYLKHQDADLRLEAVATLGLEKRLQLPEFKEQTYEIWLKDSDNLVKTTALQAWVGYCKNCQDLAELKKVLLILYKILTKYDYTIEQRVVALIGIIESVERIDRIQLQDLSNSNNSASHEILDQKIDWERINNIMREHAPDALREYPL